MLDELQRLDYLRLLDIPVWQEKSAVELLSHEQTPVTTDSTAAPLWQSLQQEVTACTACALCKTRTQTVFGVGNRNADLLIVGEAPGFYEDAQGEPFVGRAGKLLDAMLQAIGLNRQTVYIANILKCRPPNNRDPLPEEVALCTPFLQRQITLLKPKLMLAVGRIAAHFLLKSTTPLSRLRGQQFLYGEQQTPLYVTYHPAYLLRSPQDKRKAFADLLVVKDMLRMQNKP